MNEEIVKLELGEATYAKVRTSTKMQKVMEGLLPLKGDAKTSDMKGFLEKAETDNTALATVSKATRKKAETKITDELMGKMNKKYNAFPSAIKLAESNGTEQQQADASTLKGTLTNSSDIFQNKGDFMSLLKEALAKIRVLDASVFDSLNIPNVVPDLDTMMQSYESTVKKAVEKAVDSDGSVQAALTVMRKDYQNIINCFNYQQDTLGGKENKLTSNFNKFCVTYTASVKTTATAKKKADAKKASTTKTSSKK